MTNPATGKKFVFLASLILLNLVPVYGVFYWGWKSFDLIFLYWLENLIIGAFTILKLVVYPYQNLSQIPGRIFPSILFTVHYGIFCLAHGCFIVLFFSPNEQYRSQFGDITHLITLIVAQRQLGWAIIALTAYQLIDWLRDIKSNWPNEEKVENIMSAPYKRIIVLHFAIIGGGFFIAGKNDPIGGLLLLIALKIANDIYQWVKTNKQISQRENKISSEK